MIGGIILILVVSCLYEGLKTFREVLASHEAHKSSKQASTINANSEKSPLVLPGYKIQQG